MKQAIQTVLKVPPNASVVLIGDPGRRASYAKVIAALPTTPKNFIGTRPCDLFLANKTINHAQPGTPWSSTCPPAPAGR